MIPLVQGQIIHRLCRKSGAAFKLRGFIAQSPESRTRSPEPGAPCPPNSPSKGNGVISPPGPFPPEVPRWPICGNGVTPEMTPFPPLAIPWPPTSNLNCSRPALRSLRLQSATTRGKGRAAKPLYINEFPKTNREISPICFQDNTENQRLSCPTPPQHMLQHLTT